MLTRLVAACARRPGRVLALTTVLALAGTALAVTLRPSAATSTLAGHGTPEYRATQEYHRRFGDDAIAVLVRGSLPRLVLTENIDRLLGLEGCLSGNKPRGATAPGGPASPCAQLARTKPAKVVYGPGTFINQAVEEISSQYGAQLRVRSREASRAARAARQLALHEGKSPADGSAAAALAIAASGGAPSMTGLRSATRRPPPCACSTRSAPRIGARRSSLGKKTRLPISIPRAMKFVTRPYRIAGPS